MVTFLVGPDKAKKILHKSIVSSACPVLKAAFASAFEEGRTRIYTLENVDEGTFALFTEFLYTGTVDSRAAVAVCDSKLPRLWVLAEKFLLPALQNRAMDLIRVGLDEHRHILTDCLDWVYENTPVGSPLREVFVWQVGLEIDPDIFALEPDMFPVPFLLELARFFRYALNRANWLSLSIDTSYHINRFYVSLPERVGEDAAVVGNPVVSNFGSVVPDSRFAFN